MMVTTATPKRRSGRKMTTLSSSLLVSLILLLTGGGSNVNNNMFVSAMSYLYSTDETASAVIEEYIENSSDGDFFQSMGPRVVEFYNPSCGACRAFKPTYVKLAQDTKQLYPNIEFYAVSCEHNKSICKKFSISGVPSILVFQEGDDAEIESNGKKVSKGIAGKYTPSIIASTLGMYDGGDDSSNHGGTVDNSRRAQSDDDAANNGSNPSDDDAANNNGSNPSDDDAANNGSNPSDDDAANINGSNPSDDDAANNGSNPSDDDAANNGSNPSDDDAANNGYNPSDDDAANNGSNPSDDDATNNNSGGGGSVGDDDDETNQGGSASDDSNDQGSDDIEQALRGRAGGVYQRPGQTPGFGGPPGMGGGGYGGRPNPMMGGRPGASRIGNPVRYNRMQGAGTQMARAGIPRDMDRWRQQVAEKKNSIQQRQKGLRSIVRKEPSRPSSLRPMRGRTPEGKANDFATKAMRANTPGTKEYNDRKQKIIQRIDMASKRRNPVAAATLKTTASGTTPILRKGSLPYQKEIKKPSFVRKQVEKIPVVKRIVKMTAEEELILDASLSFIHGLKYGIYTSDGALSPEKKSALKNWLNLLSVSLPPEWGLHRLIDKLIKRFASVSTSDQALGRILDEYELPRKYWSKDCRRKGGVGGGFSCGFWKLMHIVTVGVAEHKGGYNLVESEMVGAETQTFSPIDAADTIREYIGHFFTCSECRDNFVKTYDNCEKNRRCARLTEETEFASDSDWKELALWLWEVHNDVSVRLLKERHIKMAAKYGTKSLKLSDEITALWPDVGGCLMCFDEDGTWDEPEVFRMLERTYWPDADLDPMSDKLLTFIGGEQRYGLGLLWILMFIGVYFVYSLVSGNSVTIQKSLFAARQIVASGGGAVVGKKKVRSV